MRNFDNESVITLRQSHLEKGNFYLQSNNYSAALAEFEKVKSLLQNDEQDFQLHKLKCLEGISWTKARMEKYSESLKDCNELIAYAFPKQLLISKFFTVRGCCYKELGNSILADRSFELANINPAFLYIVINEEGDESLPTGFTAIGCNAMGNRYFEHGLLREALAIYEKAIEINPLYVKAYFNKGVALAKSNNYNASIQAYSKAISLDPNYLDAYLNRGNSFCYTLDFKSAILDYNACLSKDPSNELAIENREYARSMLLRQG